MSWYKKILNYFYHSRLESVAKSNSSIPREMINISAAKKIGILFNASQANDIIIVTQFADLFTEQGKKVSILGYQDSNEKENTDPRFFNNTNKNWFNIPTGDKIDNFQKIDNDILICAFLEDSLPLEYIAATSKAKFRVGAFSDAKTNYFELMINTNSNQNLEYLLQQINHFLKVINS